MRHKILFFIVIFFFLQLLFYNTSVYEKSVPIFYKSLDKYWAHRVLDPQTANEISAKFNGIELDVFFESEKLLFDVRHHGPYAGRSLDDYLSKISNDSMFFWIDLKNLSSANVISVINRLDLITKENFLKDRIIIESKDIEILYQLKESGFKISYWLPPFHFFNSIFQVYEIRDNLEYYAPDAISCSYHYVDFYSRKFPNYSIHCWTNGLNFNDDTDKIEKISHIDNVRIVLIDEYYF